MGRSARGSFLRTAEVSPKAFLLSFSSSRRQEEQNSLLITYVVASSAMLLRSIFRVFTSSAWTVRSKTAKTIAININFIIQALFCDYVSKAMVGLVANVTKVFTIVPSHIWKLTIHKFHKATTYIFNHTICK